MADTSVALVGLTGAAVPVKYRDNGDGTYSAASAPAVGGSLTDRSGTITAGGTAQTLAAANAARKYLLIQNNSSADLWLNFTTTAVASQPSIRLRAGETFVMEGAFVSTQLVSVIGATTGQTFSAKEG